MRFKLVFGVEIIVLSLVFFLANIRSSIYWVLFPPVDTILSPAWRETLLWLLSVILMFYILAKNDMILEYLRSWRNEPLLVVFVLFSLISVLWSTDWKVTLHRSLSFLFATAAAVFLGVKYTRREFLRILYWFGAVVVFSSFVLALATPQLGTDLSPIYKGAWRGIFWHKNQLGNILPLLNAVFLFEFFSLVRDQQKEGSRWFVVSLYFLSLIGIFFAKSASGYILTVLLHLTFGMAILWLGVRHVLRPVHYYVILVVFVLVCAVALFNLDFVFGLFGREVHLTGRVPMWGILFSKVIPLHPWLGQGFGTIWASLDFRLYMRDTAGWFYPIMIGDNGFIDILLNLGVIGLVLFLLCYIKIWVDSIRHFYHELRMESFFPFIFMLYTFFVNLTFSMFMETEVFVWMLMIALMFIMSRRSNAFSGQGEVFE